MHHSKSLSSLSLTSIHLSHSISSPSMRIRRRPTSFPPPSPSSFLPTPPDPSNLVQSLQDATTPPPRGGEGTNSHEKERLHQDVDLHKNPHLLADQSPNVTCILPSANPILAQVKKDEEEAMEVVVVDSSKSAQVNGNKSAGAKVLVDTAKKRRGSNGSDEEDKVHAKLEVCNSASCTSDVGGASDPSATDAAAKEKGAANANGGRKRRSPPVLMEGSRCSRVNGRGWRCSQQTLVGYALCEHHLGKGRLRSVSSVRGQLGTTANSKPIESKTLAVATSVTAAQEEAKPTPQLIVKVEVEEQKEKTSALVKRRKIGTVKARSMSSLLDGADHVPMSSGAVKAANMSPLPPQLPSPSQLEAALLAASPPPLVVGRNNGVA